MSDDLTYVKLADHIHSALAAARKEIPMPACESLARGIQLLVNRHENRGRTNLLEMKDVDFLEYQKEKLAGVVVVARNLVCEIERLEPGFEDYSWDDNETTLSAIRDRLGALVSMHPEKVSQTGRPNGAWHPLARGIAAAIIRTLRANGITRGISAKNEKSVTVALGIHALSECVNHHVAPEAFQKAVSYRDRRKPSTLRRDVGVARLADQTRAR